MENKCKKVSKNYKISLEESIERSRLEDLLHPDNKTTITEKTKEIINRKVKNYMKRRLRYHKNNYSFTVQEIEPPKTCDSKYHLLYNYLQNVRLYNVLSDINNLLIKYEEEPDNKINQEIFCNQIKIFNDLFNYKKHNFKYTFEALFELLTGIELQDEQMERYVQIINSFIDYENQFNGKDYEHYELQDKVNIEKNLIGYQYGGSFNYPLHHIMMSKGKSAILNPLLALHFALVYKKIVYIIVPFHLKPSTIKRFDFLNFIFNCGIIILTDNEIKYEYLKNRFQDDEYNKNCVMIIDEFDSLIDPIKSNFNITSEKFKFDDNLIELVKQIVIHLQKNDKPLEFKITDIELSQEINDKYSEYYEIIENDIKSILFQIENNILIENINWGIHPKYYNAIPYNNKDKALENSNFTSSIMSLFLTFYYYIIIQNYSLNEYILEIIINYELLHLINEELTEIAEDIISIIESSEEYKEIIFNRIFEIIFSRKLLSKNQSNISFIDIINIKNMFKVGYSGTVNINLKPFDYLENKFNTIIDDEDEPINVRNAIMNSNILYLNKLEFKKNIDEYFEIFSCIIDLKLYTSLIDLHGLFKNIKNFKIAKELNILLKRNIIFLDEKDKEYVILINGEIEDYNSYKLYENPFLYFDQGHTIGIDIKQDKYPIMKGLCLLNNKSTYTEVAQAIFRLRKINLGHTIDLCLVNDKIEDYCIDELLDLLILNDTNKLEQTNDLLIFQTLKYEIRIYRGKNIMDNHDEIIKYYYQQETKIPLKTELDNFYIGIFTLEEIEYLKRHPKLSPLFYKINIYDKLLKLIYNIGSVDISITHSIGIDVDHNIEDLKAKEIKREINSTEDAYYLKLKLELPKLDFIMYNYIFDSIDNKKIFDLLTLHVDENIYCLPNIFTQIDGFNFNLNTSGILFVYIDRKFLIIPGYMITNFIDKHIIITINQQFINPQINKKLNKFDIIDEMRNLRLIKNINNSIMFDTPDNDDPDFLNINMNDNDILVCFILVFINFINGTSKYLFENEIILNEMIKIIFERWLVEKPIRNLLLINDKFIDIDRLNETIELFQNIHLREFYKYLKYKSKYYKKIEILNV